MIREVLLTSKDLALVTIILYVLYFYFIAKKRSKPIKYFLYNN
jgi:hypothetical protein